MKLIQCTQQIWITDYEEERDRPALGYIRTGDMSIAIDAGHSKEHVLEFYSCLQSAQLPLPAFTFLTHWHWDHTFGMHSVSGMTIAEKRTEEQLQKIISDWTDESELQFKQMDEHISKEYAHQPMIVTGAKIVFQDELELHLKDITVRAFHVDSSHTEDSILILIPEEKVLFFGDCICGAYPEWIVDDAKRNLLIETLQSLDFEIAIGGHWKPFRKKELLEALIHNEI